MSRRRQNSSPPCLALALVMSRKPEDSLAQMGSNPYVD